MNKREVLSEHDHYERSVKRKNFIALFLDGYEADKYVATHLYGEINNLSGDENLEKIENLFETSALNLSNTFAFRAHLVEKSVQKYIRKLSTGETFIALIKGYCALAILLLPKTY